MEIRLLNSGRIPIRLGCGQGWIRRGGDPCVISGYPFSYTDFDLTLWLCTFAGGFGYSGQRFGGSMGGGFMQQRGGGGLFG